jgi:hypothetical protein
LVLEYERFQNSTPAQPSAEKHHEIRSLSQHLPALWRAETTTAEDRGGIARLLIDEVVVSIEGNSERVDVDIHW